MSAKFRNTYQSRITRPFSRNNALRHQPDNGCKRLTTLLCIATLAATTSSIVVAQTYTRVNGGDIQSGHVLSDFGQHLALRSFGAFGAADSNGFSDVYVYDRWSQAFAWVSADTAGNPGNNHSGGSNGPGGPGVAISNDGRFVVFISFATNLVANDNTSGFPDVFLRDRDVSADGTYDTPGDVSTIRVSLDSNGNEANAMCTRPDISGAGSLVVFASDATNLVANDNNGARDIFLHDANNGTTSRVSLDTNNTESNGFSDTPSISRDGRFVVFESTATNLIASDANGAIQDVFIRDLLSGTTALVTQSTGGAQANTGSDAPYAGAVSGDGRYVVFESAATNLISNDNNGLDIFVRNTINNTTTLVSVNSNGQQANNTCFDPSISNDGRFIVFKSYASNLGGSGTQLRTYLHDRDADADGVMDEPGAIATTLAILMAAGPADPKNAIISPTGDSLVLFTPVPLEPSDSGFNVDLYFGDLEQDQDQDGLTDSWEVFGIDANSDGTTDLVLPNADYRRKNMYIEIDAMTGRGPIATPGSQPTGTTLDQVIATFANAPIGNPNGTTGIDLELLIDETTLPLQSWGTTPWPSFDAIKIGVAPAPGNFGTAAERGSLPFLNPNWSNIRAARMLSYRYCIFADQYCIAGPNGTQDCSVSGRAELPGNDFFISLGGCGPNGCWSPRGGNANQQAGLFLHELGHTLGLQHGGGDGLNYKPNYYSAMNYTWTLPNYIGTPGPGSYAAFWPLDFSRGSWPNLSEAGGLIEAIGINAPTNIRVPVGPLNPSARLEWTQGAIDFDASSTLTSNATADVNFVVTGNASPGQMLTGFDDWSNIALALSGHANFADGPSGGTDSTSEMCYGDLRMLAAVGDCNGNGVWDEDDIDIGGFPDCNDDGVPDECGFADAFDIYTIDPLVHGQNGWKGWDNDAAFSAMVSEDRFLTAPQAVEVEGTTDLVHEFCGATAGVWSVSVMQYIPSNFDSRAADQFAGSYFVLLNTYADSGPYDWSVQLGFDSNSGMLKAFHGDGIDTVDIPYVADRWKRIQIIVDQDDDWTRVYYDDELVTEYAWTGGVLGEGGGAADIAAVDLYANGSTSIYYDDFKLALGCGVTRFADDDGDGLNTETELRLGTDSCRPDSDGDGIWDDVDNCPNYYNDDQADCDANGIGDLCEALDGTVGDCNHNGLIDTCDSEYTDIDNFVAALLSPQPDALDVCLYDANGDEGVDGRDIAAFLRRLGL